MKDEMSRRWKESPWGRLWRGSKDGSNVSHRRWVLPNDAGTFQIGDFLGLNTYSELATRSPQLNPSVAGGSPTRAGPSTSHRAHLDDPSTKTGDTFVTARSHISPEPELAPVPSGSSFLLEASPNSGDDLHAATSTTSLLRVPAADRPAGRSRIRTGSTNDETSTVKPALRARALASVKSDSAINGPTDTPRTSDGRKGKGKKVVRLPRDPSPPAPPGAVLQRSGSEIQETSAGAAEGLQAATASSAAPIDAPDEYDDAKMKGKRIFPSLSSSSADVSSFEPLGLGISYLSATHLHDPGPDRMVVRVAYCKNGSLGSHFDEMQDRSARDMQYEDWAEFMVVWRNGRLELYNDYVSFPLNFSAPALTDGPQIIPGREWVAGHKHLAFVVPLESARTKLSLYSFTDLSFCITCPPASLRAGAKILLPFQRRTGTNIFIFKSRCRSRALDWIWRLWCVNRSGSASRLNIRLLGEKWVANFHHSSKFAHLSLIPR